MKKMKINKSLSRRVKVTGTGKIFHASNNKRHLRRNKTKSQIRRLKQNKSFTAAYEIKARKVLGLKNAS